MKKIIITLTIAMLTVTTVNAESWRNKNNRNNSRNNNTTIVVNNDRKGNDATIVNNDRKGNDVTIVNNHRKGTNVTVVNNFRPSGNKAFKIENKHNDRPQVGRRVNDIPRGAVKVHRHGRDYYRVGNVLYDKIATATGIVYSIVELLNS